MLALHVSQVNTKTKKETPSARHALPASGATRFTQQMALTAKIAKWASTRRQKALILIVSFVLLGHVEETEPLVVQTWLFAEHAILGDIAQAKTRTAATLIQPCVNLAHWAFYPIQAVQNVNGVVQVHSASGVKIVL